MDLSERVLARLDEWERVAREAMPATTKHVKVLVDSGSFEKELVAHVVLQSPRTTLALVAGLRTVVWLHGDAFAEAVWCKSCEDTHWPCPTLLAVAAAVGVEV